MKVLKKLVIGTALVLSATLTACTSVQNLSSTTNEIKSEQMVLNTYMDRSDYSVIGTASGSSEFVYLDSHSGKYVGDSGKYGYINEPSETFIGQTENGSKMFIGVGKKDKLISTDEALKRATLNANYSLIENAYEMGGDSIFEPVYTVEKEEENSSSSSTVKYRVSVRAKVIQLKIK